MAEVGWQSQQHGVHDPGRISSSAAKSIITGGRCRRMSVRHSTENPRSRGHSPRRMRSRPAGSKRSWTWSSRNGCIGHVMPPIPILDVPASPRTSWRPLPETRRRRNGALLIVPAEDREAVRSLVMPHFEAQDAHRAEIARLVSADPRYRYTRRSGNLHDSLHCLRWRGEQDFVVVAARAHGRQELGIFRHGVRAASDSRTRDASIMAPSFDTSQM